MDFTSFFFPFPFSPFFPCLWEGWFPVSPVCRVLGEQGFHELRKECTSVWSALISVEKDLIVPGFWDHYLSFTFIKSMMRKFKIKGFVNWIPVWKGEAPTRKLVPKLADGALGTVPDLSIYLQLLWQRACAKAWRGGSSWQSLRVSRKPQLCEPYNPSPARLLVFRPPATVEEEGWPSGWVITRCCEFWFSQNGNQASYFITSSWFVSWFVRRRS